MVANKLQKSCLSNASYGKNVSKINKSLFTLPFYHYLIVSCYNKNELNDENLYMDWLNIYLRNST